MKQVVFSVFLFVYSVSSLAMNSGDGAANLPWARSSFNAHQPPTKVVAKTNQTQHLLTVVFDMDETLLWQRTGNLSEPIYRHGIQDLLIYLGELQAVQMILWTAATKENVNDKLERFFDVIITRNGGNWYQVYRGSKPLRILNWVDPDRVVMFDDKSHSIKEDPHRALLVHPFHGSSGFEHQPEVDQGDLTHKHIREVIGYLLSQIEDAKTVPQALMTLAMAGGALERHECPKLNKRFLRVKKTATNDVPFLVQVESREDVEASE